MREVRPQAGRIATLGMTSGMAAWLIFSALSGPPAVRVTADEPRHVDPASWGSDHVGQAFPDYMTGDECLFCHRKIGPAWGQNRHQLTVRAAAADDPAIRQLQARFAELATGELFLMGSRSITRFLRRAEQYGQLELLSAALIPPDKERGPPTQWRHGDAAEWQPRVFGERCAGCHATAVDAETRAFAATSLDCVVCHGDVSLEHTNDTRRVLLSRTHREPRQVISLCGQCHLRGGKSRSTGLPYANTFVPGDNLFKDFELNWSDKAIERLPLVEQHIFLNAHDVAVHARTELTCVSCHDVHQPGSQKHRLLSPATLCTSCHTSETGHGDFRPDWLAARQQRRHSTVCDY